MSMSLIGLSVHAQKWHIPSSKQGGAGFCKQVLSSLTVGVDGDNTITKHRCNSSIKKEINDMNTNSE